MITVLLFATLKDVAKTNRLELEIAGTVAEVRAALAAHVPALARHLPTAICAVNKEFAFPTDMVNAGDEVAFFPPVSGGSGEKAGQRWPEIARLADAPFSTDELITAITTPETGAVCAFSGMVRGRTQRATESVQETERLEYEAYESMAVAKMRQVIAEIRAQWLRVQGVAIVQRVGRLEVGQNTIVIACASGHRDEGCFEAARYGIDRLKEIVPVWKREVRPDGSSWVEGDYLPEAQDRAVPAP